MAKREKKYNPQTYEWEYEPRMARITYHENGRIASREWDDDCSMYKRIAASVAASVCMLILTIGANCLDWTTIVPGTQPVDNTTERERIATQLINTMDRFRSSGAKDDDEFLVMWNDLVDELRIADIGSPLHTDYGREAQQLLTGLEPAGFRSNANLSRQDE